MATTDVQLAATTDDATSLQNTTGYTGTGSGAPNAWLSLTRQTTTAASTVVGWRILVPSTIPAASITSATLGLVLNNSNAGMTGVKLVVEPGIAAAWANDATNMPNARYVTATGAGASETTWDITAQTAGVRFYSPDLSTAIKATVAANGSHASTGTYIGILAKAPTGSNNTMQVFSRDNTTTPTGRPYLRIVDNSGETYDAITALDVVYADGTGVTTGQVCDIYVPAGQPDDAEGRRFIVWLHGGFWRTGVASKAALYTPFRDYCLERGFVFVNAEYNKVQSDILVADNTGPSHPYPVLDMRTLMKFLAANAAEYRIDVTRGFITGESAGGHVALEAFVTQGDTATYTGYQNAANNRGSMPGNTAPAFDFDRNLTTTAFQGVFTWVAPVDMTEATKNPNELNAAAVNLGRTGYMGSKQGQNPSTTSGNTDELDINRYITGTGRCYTTAHTPTGPIGFCYGTADDIVIQASSVDAIYNALPTYDRPTEGTISTSTTGLSRYPAQGKTHTNTMRDEGSWTFFLNWMNTIDPPTPQPVQAGPRVPSRPSVPSVPTVG